MNVVDVILVIIMVLAAVGGWRTSGAARSGRLAGLLLGALIGLVVAGAVIPATASTGTRLLVGLGLVILGALIIGGLGGWVGVAVARGLRSLRLGVADRLLGAALSGVLALFIGWLLLTVATVFWPDTGLAAAIEASRLVQAVDEALPALVPQVP